MSKSPATNSAVAIVKETLQSPRANPILVGALIGGTVMAVSLFTVAIWLLK